jgi:hypothetical protein
MTESARAPAGQPLPSLAGLAACLPSLPPSLQPSLLPSPLLPPFLSTKWPALPPRRRRRQAHVAAVTAAIAVDKVARTTATMRVSIGCWHAAALHIMSLLQLLPAGDDPSAWLKRTRHRRAGAGYRVANTRSRRPNAGSSLGARAGGSCPPARPSSATVQEERREKARCRRLHSPRSAWKPDSRLRHR